MAKLGKSGLAGKLGDKLLKAHEKHKGDELVYNSGGDVPGGITGGVARLTECKFDVYKSGNNVGEYYFYASGVCVSPKEFEGMRLSGLRTSIMEPLCETPGKSRETLEDHLEFIYNELRKLGVDTNDVEPESLEEVAKELVEAAPYFTFSTKVGRATEQYPNPKVFHNWNGLVDDYIEDTKDGETSEGVTDNTSKKVTPTGNKTKVGTSSPTKEIGQLVDEANDDNTSSQEELINRAVKAGVEQSTIDEASTWDEIGDLLVDALKNDKKVPISNKATDADSSNGVPKIGETWMYSEFNPRTKKQKAPREFEILKVDKKAKTVDLSDPENENVTIRGVAWSELDHIPY